MHPELAEWIQIAADYLISLPTVALFGLAWHRRILLGEPAASWLRCHAWTARHAPFFVWSLALSSLTLVASIPLLSHPRDPWLILLWTLVLLGAAYIMSKLSLALPATAVGAASDARSIWSLSQGTGVSLVVILGLTALAVGALLFPIEFLLAAAIATFPAWEYVWLALLEAQAFLVTAIEISALSLSFKRLTPGLARR
jgi:hypothetical protein